MTTPNPLRKQDSSDDASLFNLGWPITYNIDVSSQSQVIAIPIKNDHQVLTVIVLGLVNQETQLVVSPNRASSTQYRFGTVHQLNIHSDRLRGNIQQCKLVDGSERLVQLFRQLALIYNYDDIVHRIITQASEHNVGIKTLHFSRLRALLSNTPTTPKGQSTPTSLHSTPTQTMPSTPTKHHSHSKRAMLDVTQSPPPSPMRSLHGHLARLSVHESSRPSSSSSSYRETSGAREAELKQSIEKLQGLVEQGDVEACALYQQMTQDLISLHQHRSLIHTPPTTPLKRSRPSSGSDKVSVWKYTKDEQLVYSAWWHALERVEKYNEPIHLQYRSTCTQTNPTEVVLTRETPHLCNIRVGTNDMSVTRMQTRKNDDLLEWRQHVSSMECPLDAGLVQIQRVSLSDSRVEPIIQNLTSSELRMVRGISTVRLPQRYAAYVQDRCQRQRRIDSSGTYIVEQSLFFVCRTEDVDEAVRHGLQTVRQIPPPQALVSDEVHDVVHLYTSASQAVNVARKSKVTNVALVAVDATVGHMEAGSSDLSKPSSLPTQSYMDFDSVCNNLVAPTLYCIWKPDVQVLPTAILLIH